MFDDVLRFWLDRGVDGFRVDVAHGLYKEEASATGRRRRRGAGQRRVRWSTPWSSGPARRADVGPARGARRLPPLAQGPRRLPRRPDGRRRGVDPDRGVDGPLIRSDELHQTFNFHWLTAPWSAAAFAEVVDQTLDAVGLVEGSPTWVLSNHDVIRHVTRYGGGEVGLARAKAATLTMLALPGSAYVYQGEELGLEQVDVAPEFRQDPSWLRTGEPGRDGCRVPIPWSGTHAPYGFGPGDRPAVDPAAGRLGRRSPSRPRRPTPTRRCRSTGRRWRLAVRSRRRRATRSTCPHRGRRAGHRRGPVVRCQLRLAPGAAAGGRAARRQRPARHAPTDRHRLPVDTAAWLRA